MTFSEILMFSQEVLKIKCETHTLPWRRVVSYDIFELFHLSWDCALIAFQKNFSRTHFHSKQKYLHGLRKLLPNVLTQCDFKFKRRKFSLNFTQN